jgi:hypothetical protein
MTNSGLHIQKLRADYIWATWKVLQRNRKRARSPEADSLLLRLCRHPYGPGGVRRVLSVISLSLVASRGAASPGLGFLILQ